MLQLLAELYTWLGWFDQMPSEIRENSGLDTLSAFAIPARRFKSDHRQQGHAVQMSLLLPFVSFSLLNVDRMTLFSTEHFKNNL